jgi:hypothetical protein
MDPRASTSLASGRRRARPPASSLLRAMAGALVAGVVLAACSGSDVPIVSFDPSTPCTTDGQQPGAYPELEALLPGTWNDRAPDSLDSGRTCTTEALGSLATHGIEELRFAGATWPVGPSSGFTFAVFEAVGLDAGRVVDFYEAGSRSVRPGDEYRTTDTAVGGRPAVRLDVTGSDGSSQTVVAWPGPGASADGASRVFALLTASMGDSQVAELLETFGEP